MEIPILNRKYIFIHGGFSIASHVSLPGGKNDSFTNYFFVVAVAILCKSLTTQEGSHA